MDTEEYGFGGNMFAYCENNSINLVDYSGEWGQQHYAWTRDIAELWFCPHYAHIIAKSNVDMNVKFPPFPKKGVGYKKW